MRFYTQEYIKATKGEQRRVESEWRNWDGTDAQANEIVDRQCERIGVIQDRLKSLGQHWLEIHHSDGRIEKVFGQYDRATN